MNLIGVLESHYHTVPCADQEKGSWSWGGGHPSAWRAQVVLTSSCVSIGGRQMCLETGRTPVTCTEHPPVASVILDLQHPYLFLVSGHALFPRD